MKSFKQLFIISAILGLTACSAEDESVTGPVMSAEEWTECSMTMESQVPGFDLSATRAVNTEIKEIIKVGWPDKARVYISFMKSDNTTTYGSAVYDASTESWTLSYNGRLDAATPTECKVYYFEGESVTDNAIHTVVQPSVNTAVYGGTGSYNYKDGNVNLSVTLAPLTSRIRFKRSTTNGNVTGYMRNVRTMSSFDLTSCNFVMTSPMDRVTVSFQSGQEYSDYIYAVQDFTGFSELEELKNEVRVSDGKYVYSYELPQNSDFMKIGDSGYMNWPTPDHHNGWYSYVQEAAKKLSNISTNNNKANVNYDIEASVNKFDVIRTTLRSDYFYGNSSYSSSAAFKMKIGDATVIDMTAGSPIPGVISGNNHFVYYVASSNQTLHISWESSYWYSNTSYNFIDHIIFQ